MKNIDFLKKDSNSMQYCRKLQKYFIDTINKKYQLDNPKYHFHLFIMDDLICEKKFWYKLNLIWYDRKYDRWYDLKDKFVIDWYNPFYLFDKACEFIEENKHLFLNPYYNENNG